MKHNFHTHTARCQHAVGTDEEYVKAAMEGGFDVLGFADHAPWPFASGFVSTIRMGAEDWPCYAQSVKDLQHKYAGQLDIHLGLESEYFPRYLDHMKRLRDEGCAYFILGQHFVDTEECNPYIGKECASDDGLMRYADSSAEAIATGMYCYVAHPDLFMRPRLGFDKACEHAADIICQAAKEYGLPIEYNLLGLNSELTGNSRGYPDADFWRYVRKWDNDVILGVDAHAPAHLTDTRLWDIGMQRVQALGYKIVDNI